MSGDGDKQKGSHRLSSLLIKVLKPFRRSIGSLVFLTTSDYVIVMNTVRIADLKSRLSEYLRKVRRGGSLTVLDRDTPIARIVPYEGDSASLKVRSPLPDAPKLQRVPLPPPLRLQRDIVKFLMEERQGER